MSFTGAMGGGMAFSAGLGFFPSLFGLQFVRIIFLNYDLKIT
jgi:predicted lipid-binding transport protein (Tim44 family)